MCWEIIYKPNSNYKNGTTKLALDSKLLYDQIFENKYQMPHIHELIDNIALQLSNKESNERFSSS